MIYPFAHTWLTIFVFLKKKRHLSYKRRDHISWELQYMSIVFFYVKKTCGFSYNSDLALKIWHYMSPFFVPNMYILWWKKLTLFTFWIITSYRLVIIIYSTTPRCSECIRVKINWFWCKHNTTETFFYAKKASFPHFFVHYRFVVSTVCRDNDTLNVTLSRNMSELYFICLNFIFNRRIEKWWKNWKS